jgi:hypothetical protein
MSREILDKKMLFSFFLFWFVDFWVWFSFFYSITIGTPSSWQRFAISSMPV